MLCPYHLASVAEAARYHPLLPEPVLSVVLVQALVPVVVVVLGPAQTLVLVVVLALVLVVLRDQQTYVLVLVVAALPAYRVVPVSHSSTKDTPQHY